MYKRYIIVGIVFFLLVGAYFVFFYDKKDNTYGEYYDKLIEKGNYSDSLNGVDLSIVENIEKDNKYSYIITFDKVSIVNNNVKILVSDGSEDSEKYFPSFGIVDNEGYSIIPVSEEKGDKQVKGVNLTILESEKINYLLIYYNSNGNEQFVRVKVSNYLG